jgi:hypothetical protein
MTALCPHDEIPAACLDCLTGKPPERPNAAEPKPERVGGVWPANWPGHCAGCNTAIHEGQPICRMTDGGYRHERCA